MTGASCAASGSASSSRGAYQERWPAGSGALRAPLKTLKTLKIWCRKGHRAYAAYFRQWEGRGCPAGCSVSLPAPE